MPRLSHAGDDCAYGRIAKDEAQSHLWQSQTCRQQCFEFFRALDTRNQIFRHEVNISPITFRPLARSEEHTSELQSRGHLVCRLLLEKKKNKIITNKKK